VLQGLQGVNLTQEQLLLIQQKVKTELLKQQAMARQQNRPPPTKVSELSPPVVFIATLPAHCHSQGSTDCTFAHL
jgi:hypothetical protein